MPPCRTVSACPAVLVGGRSFGVKISYITGIVQHIIGVGECNKLFFYSMDNTRGLIERWRLIYVCVFIKEFEH